MRAVMIDEWTDPEALRVRDVPDPELRPGTALIDVKAAGCNFFDTLIVRGKYQVKPSFPFAPGGEISGVVRSLGPGVSGVAIGQSVAARVGYGGFAERVVVPADALLAVPASMSFEEAAAFPIVYGTAYAAVVLRGAVREAETVLVTAAAGGVGLACVQVARAVGARVIALASGDKLDVPRQAGAHAGVDYREKDWIERVLSITDGRGADVIVENVGGDVFDGCTRCIAWGGRLVVSGFSSGTIPEMRVNRVMLKHISIVGVHFGPMAEHEPDVVRDLYRRLFALYEAGQIRPVVSATFPLERVSDALAALGSRQTVGKVVLLL
jgi:NADPH2:quinone reductase